MKTSVDKILDLAESAYEMFDYSDTCPFCNHQISLESLDNQRKKQRRISNELDLKIKVESQMLNEIQIERKEIKNSIENRSNQMHERDRFRAEMNAAKKELDERQNLTDDIDGEIVVLEGELMVLQNDYAGVSSSLKSEIKDELKRVQAEIEGFEDQIKTKRRDLDKHTESIPDYISGERFGDYANKKNSDLEKLCNETAVFKEQYNKEMFGAIDKFNSSIQDIYNNLGFKRFNKLEIVKKMNMDELDSLNLIMQDENGTEQAIDTLTKAEQLTIGMVLQISAKDSYIPDFPFFVLDENINAYDQDRYAGVLKYLADKAEYVIVSQKVPYSEQKEVIIKHGIT
ncbi:MAG: hypothetical protein KAH86_06645 [Methanosarcinales archaeon]|nr:hypothetical protein [Methanosarcinales archaeon]